MIPINYQKSKNIKFRKIRGRIIPIAVGSGVTAATGAILSKTRPGKTIGPDPIFKYASYGTQVASGLVGAFPTKTKLGFALSLGGSIALDTLATALNAKSVAGMKGNRWEKAKAFGQQQLVGSGIGYGIFGASLLGQKSFRAKASKFVSKFLFRRKTP